MSLWNRRNRRLLPKPKESPIQNSEGIDLVGKRRDGGVDLAIVASGPLDDAPETLQTLRRKVEVYLATVAREDFQEDMGHPAPEKISLILVCSHPIHPKAAAAIEECKALAKSRGVTFELRTSMS